MPVRRTECPDEGNARFPPEACRPEELPAGEAGSPGTDMGKSMDAYIVSFAPQLRQEGCYQ